MRRGAPVTLDRAQRFMLRCEAWLGRRSAAMQVIPPPIDPVSGDASRPVLVLDGGEGPSGSLHPLFEGESGVERLFRCLLEGRAPRLAVARIDATGTGILSEGLPALRDPSLLSTSLDDCYDRLICLIAAALLAPSHNPPALGRSPRRLHFPLDTPAGFLLHGLVGKAVRRLVPRREHWRVAARPRGADGSSLHVLPDDGARYYADPFPLLSDGRLHVFFENLPSASRRGVISAAVLSETGFSRPIEVLARPYHLSYPFVFAEGGEIYMMPESADVRRLELYRAAPFPERWELAGVLLEGVAVADATLIRHGGRYWLFATSAEPPGTSWDRLLLFHSPALQGPWRAHRRNPVLIDAGAARPAGRMWHEGDQLMRVAMDCRGGYGNGVVVLRVDRLDPDGYAQTPVASVDVPPGADGLHTFNSCAGYDLFDLRDGRSSPGRRAGVRPGSRYRLFSD